MIDIGVNLTNSRFDKDRDDVLLRASQHGVSKLIVTGTSLDESAKAIKLCEENPEMLVCTAGIHPHDADGASANFIEELTLLAHSPFVKAIGECGLDFNRNFSTPANQQRVFSAQIELAAKLTLPLFLHQRDAFSTWFSLLTPFINKVPAMVAHCFTGNESELMQCIDAGMYIGITGWVCDERRGKTLQELVPQIPLERLMIETDAPYLTPRTIRPRPKSSRNEPSYLPYVAQQLAQLYQCSVDEVITASRKNSQQVFGLVD